MQIQKDFGPDGLHTWQTILNNHKQMRRSHIVDLFDDGLRVLEINSDRIPDLNEINRKLKMLSGFQGVFVNGLEESPDFYSMLARREFPIGNFVRAKKDLTYTPEPDLVHDLYGHLPFFANKDYADFCQDFGKRAICFLSRPDLLRQFERFFWFTIEFGLIKTTLGNRVFGAGIASSIGECKYALSDKPELLPFDVDRIRRQEFRIDQMQNTLFILESAHQLYSSLSELSAKVEDDQ